MLTVLLSRNHEVVWTLSGKSYKSIYLYCMEVHKLEVEWFP